jgi:RHS repeat-associated protein
MRIPVRQHLEDRFQTLATGPECPDPTPPFSYTTTEHNYAATEGVSAHRRHAGDRSTTVLGGVPYYGYRFYNPGLGRWVSRDPIGEIFRNLEINNYIFVGNNSMTEIDLYGLYSRGGWAPPGQIIPVPREDSVIVMLLKAIAWMIENNFLNDPEEECRKELEIFEGKMEKKRQELINSGCPSECIKDECDELTCADEIQEEDVDHNPKKSS